MPDTFSRRDLLRIAAGAAGAAGAALVPGCGRASGGADSTRVPLASLGPAGATVSVDGKPVHVRRRGDEVVANSLLCTHMGCVVRWDEAQSLYVCPCHEGRFDADGKNVEGPPPRPLERLPVRLDGGDAVVG